MDLDFGYSQNASGSDAGSENGNDKTTDVTNIDSGNVENQANGEDADDLNDVTTEKDVDSDKENNDSNDSDKESLQAGTSIEVGNETYTVDESGNILDKNGNIFKEAKDVKAWLDSFEEVTENNDENAISIDSIREAVGIDITDDNDKPIERKKVVPPKSHPWRKNMMLR